MKWVLLIMLGNSFHGGDGIDHMDFATEKDCRAMEAKVSDQLRQAGFPFRIECLEK